MRPTIIAGNWKMNNTRKEARALAEALAKLLQGRDKDLPQIIVAPPFTSIEAATNALQGAPVAVAAQNMDHHESGAFTGEVSPLMLLELGVKHVIIGHSERRQLFGETNASVNLKVKAALKHGLTPIICVGETLDERENNLTDSVISRQVTTAIEELDEAAIKAIVIAYEPVWAIGTGKVCESDEADRVIGVIRQVVNNRYPGSQLGDATPVLYGGSMNSKNAGELLQKPNIDGGLIGGASLKADEFFAIVEAGQKRLLSTAR